MISHWGLFEHEALENKEAVLYFHFADGEWWLGRLTMPGANLT